MGNEHWETVGQTGREEVRECGTAKSIRSHCSYSLLNHTFTETARGSGLSESLLLSPPRPQPLLQWNLVLLGSLPAPAWDERMVTWAPLGSRQGQASSVALLS